MLDDNSYELPGKIALVHEWFSPRAVGGAEKVVQAIDEILVSKSCDPQLVALINADVNRTGSWLFGRSVKTSFIQNLPFGRSHVQNYLPILPFAIEQIDLSEYPLVISSNHLVAKGVLTSPDQMHLSYVHTPVRYAWDQMNVYLSRSKAVRLGLGPLVRWQLHCLRQWDQLSGGRVDCLLANSRFTARRIYRYWGRESQVVHPPVCVDRFRWDQPRDDFYLCLCRLVPNKRVDLVVAAFNTLGLPLIVVGAGPEKPSLERLAGPTVTLLGRQTEKEIETLMETCKAFIYAGVEDFGIAPVEAMAAGAPVIGFRKGGLLDTVRCVTRVSSSPTGLFFSEQSVRSIVEAVSWFEEKRLWEDLPSEAIRFWAEGFRPEVFRSSFENALRLAWSQYKDSLDVDTSDAFHGSVLGQ